MSLPEHIGRAAGEAVSAMRSTPLAIALLCVNVAFLGFATYLLGEISANAKERNKSQLAMIDRLVTECRGRQ